MSGGLDAVGGSRLSRTLVLSQIASASGEAASLPRCHRTGAKVLSESALEALAVALNQEEIQGSKASEPSN